MLGRLLWRYGPIVALVAVILGSVTMLVQMGKDIERRDAALKVERARQDTMNAYIAALGDTVQRARVAQTQATQRARRSDARAQLAEDQFLAYAAQMDTVRAQASDTLTGLPVLTAFRDSAVRTVQACRAARDSMRTALDVALSQCEVEGRRADSLQKLVRSHERTDSIHRSTPRRGHLEGAKRVGSRAIVVAAVLKVLGVF